jgi:hypothetical protein
VADGRMRGAGRRFSGAGGGKKGVSLVLARRLQRDWKERSWKILGRGRRPLALLRRSKEYGRAGGSYSP